MVSADKRISNLPIIAGASRFSCFTISHYTFHDSLSLSFLWRKSNPAVLNIHATLFTVCPHPSIPPQQASTHKHAHILTSVQYERGLSQAGSHDLSDTGSLVNGHPPTGKKFKVLYKHCLMTLSHTNTCPFSASVLSWRQEASKTLHPVVLQHSPFFSPSLWLC